MSFFTDPPGRKPPFHPDVGLESAHRRGVVGQRPAPHGSRAHGRLGPGRCPGGGPVSAQAGHLYQEGDDLWSLLTPFDADGDGDIDLAAAPTVDRQPWSNDLFLNDGNGAFYWADSGDCEDETHDTVSEPRRLWVQLPAKG